MSADDGFVLAKLQATILVEAYSAAVTSQNLALAKARLWRDLVN